MGVTKIIFHHAQGWFTVALTKSRTERHWRISFGMIIVTLLVRVITNILLFFKYHAQHVNFVNIYLVIQTQLKYNKCQLKEMLNTLHYLLTQNTFSKCKILL